MAKPKKKQGVKPPKPAQQKEEVEIPPHRKLYVGNLGGVDITEAKLRDLFEVCGEITSLELVTTAKHAFAFVEFSTVEEATAAIEKLNGASGMAVKYGRLDRVLAAVPPITKEAANNEEEEDSPDEDTQEEEKENLPTPEEESKGGEVVIMDVGAARLAASREYPNPVESLQGITQKALRVTSTTDHIVYDVQDAEDGAWVATVQIFYPCGHTTTHRGDPKENKREARKSAALVALRDPEVHRHLPPLPTKEKVREPKTTRPALIEEDSRGMALKAKERRRQEAAELRARKIAARKAAKATKAAAAENAEQQLEEEEDEGEGEETESEDTEAEAFEEESRTSASDPDSEAATLAARRAAVRAALAAQREARHRPGRQSSIAAEINKELVQSKKKVAEKLLHEEFKLSQEKVKDTRLQENFGLTKFIKP